MLTVDANVILRLILNDNAEMVKAARLALSKDFFFIKHEVLAEVVYVLAKMYNVSRDDISKAITGILKNRRIRVESKKTVRYAISAYQSHSLDFVDCMLYAYQIVREEEIFTFDKKLQKLLNQPNPH